MKEFLFEYAFEGRTWFTSPLPAMRLCAVRGRRRSKGRKTMIADDLEFREYTEAEKELIRERLRLGNDLARQVAIERGASLHPRVATIKARRQSRVMGSCSTDTSILLPGSIL